MLLQFVLSALFMGCDRMTDFSSKVAQIDGVFKVGEVYEINFQALVWACLPDGPVYESENLKLRPLTAEQYPRFEKDQRMLQDGQALILEKGTKVEVIEIRAFKTIDSKWLYVGVEVVAGDHIGLRATIDRSWNTIRGSGNEDIEVEGTALESYNFPYPDPKYFKKVKSSAA